jgi:hypothetical protein
MTKTTKNPSGYPVFRYRFGLGTCQSWNNGANHYIVRDGAVLTGTTSQ